MVGDFNLRILIFCGEPIELIGLTKTEIDPKAEREKKKIK